MKHVLSCLIELFTGILIEGYEESCCGCGMRGRSNRTAGEVEYGTYVEDDQFIILSKYNVECLFKKVYLEKTLLLRKHIFDSSVFQLWTFKV